MNMNLFFLKPLAFAASLINQPIMKFNKFSSVLFAGTAFIFSLMIPAAKAASDSAAGNLIQFNDNGAWTWYSDERTVVDPIGGKVLVGVDVSGAGLGGSPRDG